MVRHADGNIKPAKAMTREGGHEAGSRLAASFQAIPALASPKTLKETMEIAREEAAQEAAREGL